MDLDLPHLSQQIELDRGMPLHKALTLVSKELLYRNPQAGQRLTITETLSLRAMSKVLKRVDGLQQRDKVVVVPPPAANARRPKKPKPPRPHRFTLKYDELAIVRFYYARLLATAADDMDRQNYLATVLGRFYQPSLNLESHIDLSAPTGPGCQTSLF